MSKEEEFELNDHDLQRIQEEQREDDDDDEEETNFGGNNVLDNIYWLGNKGREEVEINHLDPLNKYFENKTNEARNIGFFIKDVLLLTEVGATNPRFIKYLMEKYDFEIKNITSISNPLGDYEGSFYGEPYYNEDGIKTWPPREFKSNNNVIQDPKEYEQLYNDIRYHLDEWNRIERDKLLKRGEIATAVGLTLVTLITGLSLGLKCAGSDIKNSAIIKKRKTKKLTPAQKRKIMPWLDLVEATGKGVITIGDNLYHNCRDNNKFWNI